MVSGPESPIEIMVRMASLRSKIFLFTGALLLVCALPVMPSLLNKNGYYGLVMDLPTPELPAELVPEQGLSVVYFGYRQCGTVCPVQLVNLLNLRPRLQGQPVEFVFVTLDPENDSQDLLDMAMAGLGEGFRAYRPDSQRAAQNLALAFGDFAIRDARSETSVLSHGARLYVVSPGSRRRLVYTSPDLDLDLVEKDIRHLLADMAIDKEAL